jgi:hypothetical protein
MRIALLFPLALLAACSSDKPADDTLVTLDGPDAAAAAVANGSAPVTAEGESVQAVDSEGPKLEPLLSSAISEAGLVSSSCRFSPAEGALPVLVASTAGGKALVSVGGRQIDVAPSGAVTPTGATLAGQGISLSVTANTASGSASRLGSTASMQVTDADGPAYTYQNGFWACI